MIVQDIYVTISILGNDIFSLKGKITSNKTILVIEGINQVPKELINLHKDIVITADIFFVNTIPFLLTLRRNVLFTMVHHIENRKVKTIYTATI